MNTDTTPEAETARSIVHSVIRGERLDHAATRTVFSALGAGLLTGVETAALLAGLHARGETDAELAGAADAFKAAARPFPKVSRPLVEIVGTGGDGVGTINISTGAGLTAASMGLAVAKHGNRAVSSKTGAADVIAELGLPLDLSPEQAARALEEAGADALVLFQLAHHGPKAALPIIKDIKETADSSMLAFLDRVPPEKAVRVRVEPGSDDVLVWNHNGKHYLRTTHTLMWPAWTAVVNGAGNTKCYEVPVTSRLMLSRNGQIQTIRLQVSQ